MMSGGGGKMQSRLKQIRKAVGLNQTEFGEKIGVKQATVAAYECGARNPLDTVIKSICREFDVNENWLRTGEGEMFRKLTRDERIADFVADVLRDEPDSFRKRFISMLSSLNEDQWKMLELFAEGLNKKED